MKRLSFTNTIWNKINALRVPLNHIDFIFIPFKGHLLVLALFIGISTIINAQEKIDVTIETVALARGNQPVYMVTIPESNIDLVKKEWIKQIRQNTKSKVEENGGEIVIKGTLIKSVYDRPFNIYSILIGSDSVLRLYAAFEIDSVFFTMNESNTTVHNEKTHNAIIGFLRNFAVGQYQFSVGQQLEMEQKKLTTLNKEFQNMTEQVETFNKEIAENEQNIKNSQDALATYQKDNERKITEIDKKKESNSAISDPELQKQGKSQLKDLEKEKKSIENKLESNRKNIIKNQADIEQFKREIENNLKLQEDKKTEIINQENMVKIVTAKLNGIK